MSDTTLTRTYETDLFGAMRDLNPTHYVLIGLTRDQRVHTKIPATMFAEQAIELIKVALRQWEDIRDEQNETATLH